MFTAKKSPGLHMVIGSVSNSPDTPFNVDQGLLTGDLQLIKAALLYADGATIASPASAIILAFLSVAELPKHQQLELMMSWMEATAKSPADTETLHRVWHEFTQLSNAKSLGQALTNDETLRLFRLSTKLDETMREITETIVSIARAAGADEMIQALESGLINLHIFQNYEGTDSLVTEYFQFVANAISDPHNYPIFDARTSSLVRAGAQEGVITVTDAGAARAKHAALAAHLIERLPLFERASIKETLQIRNELEAPLTNFRSAIISFSDEIRTSAWDNDFAYEGDKVLWQKIEPAVAEIEEAVSSNRFLKKLARKVIDKPLALPSGPGIALIMSQINSLPAVMTHSAGLAAEIALPSLATVYEAYEDWRHDRSILEQNHLYFYYRARKSFKELGRHMH